MPRMTIRHARRQGVLTIALTAFVGVLCSIEDARSEDNTTDALINELLRKLEQRDAVIADLQRRLEAIERQLADPTPGTAAPAPSATAAAEQQPVQKTANEDAASGARKAPGTFEVREDAAERALERSLVQTGVLLLPKGQFEVEPFFGYARRENDYPILIGSGAQASAGSETFRRNEFDFGVGLRFGLPYDSQIEFGLPFRVVDESVVDSVGFAPQTETSSTGSGLGDVQIGIAKTLLREKGWRPDLIGRLTWDTDTGQQTDNGVVLGQGFNELRASLTALKRQDPLAFSFDFYYQGAFEKDNIEPGDQVGFGFNAYLAASPETSLRLGLLQSFSDEVQVNGTEIAGSDQTSGVLILGASSLLGRRTLLDFSVGVGLTDDAPDYFLGISVPIRYDLLDF